MEKKVCKVLYKAEMPKEYKNILFEGRTEIGLFENFDDAFIASNFWVKILKEVFKKSKIIKSDFQYAITKVLVPDDEQVKYYSSIEQFRSNDLYVDLYFYKKGQKAIKVLEDQIKQELNELTKADKEILTREKECDVTHPPVKGPIKNLSPLRDEPEADTYVL